MATIDLQKFMELRESVRARQQEAPARKSAAASGDWRTLLESKRQEIGLAPAPETRSVVASAVRVSADDLQGRMDEKVEELRERRSQGLAVRELGNFIDVRA